MQSESSVWKVWRLTTGQAKIAKCVVQKKTPSYIWAVEPYYADLKLSNRHRFDVNGHSQYSGEPCLERLFFFESQAIAYAAELNKNPKPYS